MDLQCKLTWMRGTGQWVGGLCFPIGLDGYLRGIPPELGAELLENHAVWSRPAGEVPPASLSIPLTMPGAPPPPVALGTGSVGTMLKTRALLTKLEVPLLEGLAREIDLDLEDAGVSGAADAVAAILDQIDTRTAETFSRRVIELANPARPLEPAAKLPPAEPLPPPPQQPTRLAPPAGTVPGSGPAKAPPAAATKKTIPGKKGGGDPEGGPSTLDDL